MNFDIQQIIGFFHNNGQEILAGIGGLYLFLLAVVHATPTKKDDELLGKAYDFVHRIIGIFGIKK